MAKKAETKDTKAAVRTKGATAQLKTGKPPTGAKAAVAEAAPTSAHSPAARPMSKAIAAFSAEEITVRPDELERNRRG